MGQLVLAGSLTAGPPNGADLGPGPRMLMNVPLAFQGGSYGKQYNAATGVLTRNVNDGSFTALQGVGSTDTVTRGDTLYILTNTPLDFRLTTDDGVGGDVVSVVPVNGFVLLEFPQAKFLKLLEVKGAGVIEYFVSGPS